MISHALVANLEKIIIKKI